MNAEQIIRDALVAAGYEIVSSGETEEFHAASGYYLAARHKETRDKVVVELHGDPDSWEGATGDEPYPYFEDEDREDDEDEGHPNPTHGAGWQLEDE